MDVYMANLLKDVLNRVKHLYDLAGPLEEELIRPLMQSAYEIAKALKLPYDLNCDEGTIEQWILITEAKVKEINELLLSFFKQGDAS